MSTPRKSASSSRSLWIALAGAVATMVFIAMIVRSDGPRGEIGTPEWTITFAGVLVSAVIMTVALIRTIVVNRRAQS